MLRFAAAISAMQRRVFPAPRLIQWAYLIARGPRFVAAGGTNELIRLTATNTPGRSGRPADESRLLGRGLGCVHYTRSTPRRVRQLSDKTRKTRMYVVISLSSNRNRESLSSYILYMHISCSIYGIADDANCTRDHTFYASCVSNRSSFEHRRLIVGFFSLCKNRHPYYTYINPGISDDKMTCTFIVSKRSW